MNKNEVIDLIVRCVKKAERIDLEKLGSNVSTDVSLQGFISALEAEREEEEPWEPSISNVFFYIKDEGFIGEEYWNNDTIDNARKNCFGVYPTEAKAIEVRDAIKSFLKEWKV